MIYIIYIYIIYYIYIYIYVCVCVCVCVMYLILVTYICYKVPTAVYHSYCVLCMTYAFQGLCKHHQQGRL